MVRKFISGLFRVQFLKKLETTVSDTDTLQKLNNVFFSFRFFDFLGV